MPVGYGRTIRHKLKSMDKKRTASYECPSCGKKKVRRKSNSVWSCLSCGHTFAGGTYAPETPVGAAAKKNIKKSQPRS